MEEMKTLTLNGVTYAPRDTNLADYTPYNGKKNFATNLLHIDLTNPDAFCNKESVVAVEDASTLTNSPITSGAFYAYREVLFVNNPTGGLPKCAVRLTQIYPSEGLIWLNIYDPNYGYWIGWKKFEDSAKLVPASALTPRVYVAKGPILTSDGTARGSGTATVHITPDGIARIDYAVAITADGTDAGSYSVGLDIALLRAVNQNIPAITPLAGGSCVYYRKDGTLYIEKTQYGGFHTTWLNNGRWSLGRVYTPDGSDGSWSDSQFIVGHTIAGTCYGQVPK